MAKKHKKRKLKLSIWTAAVLFVVSQLTLLIPYDSVPANFRPIYDILLSYRNKAINRLNLPIELYPSQTAVNDGEFQAKLFFAPSPGLEDELVKFINSAQKSLEICVFELNLEEMIDAIIKQHQHGVNIRIIIDADYQNDMELSPLYKAGIPLKVDPRSAFMHNKFIVADGKQVWTGSQNFTKNCTFKNDNNALLINSFPLAQNYQKEFDEMWNDGKGFFSTTQGFGSNSPANTPNPIIFMGTTKVENYFAPEDAVMKRILNTVRQAKNSVTIMAFSFTADELANLLIRLRHEEVKIKILFDSKSSESEHSALKILQENEITCLISPNRRGVMHHKVIIIDEKIVITGSFNFSKNADLSNDENLLIIHSPSLAKAYEEEFQRCIRGVKGY